MRVDAMTLMQLPAGPTAYFKLTSVQLGSQIYVSRCNWQEVRTEASVFSQGHARPSPHSR